MNLEDLKTIKIGLLKIDKIEDRYNLSDVIAEYNIRNDKNRSLWNFTERPFGHNYLTELSRLMNVFFGAKTYNPDSMFEYVKQRKVRKKNPNLQSCVYSNPVLFAEFVKWCFPKYAEKANSINKEWIMSQFGVKHSKEYIEWLHKVNPEKFDNDTLTYLRELNLVRKFLYAGSDNRYILEEVITLNKSMIEVDVPFKDRVIVTSRFFNK